MNCVSLVPKRFDILVPRGLFKSYKACSWRHSNNNNCLDIVSCNLFCSEISFEHYHERHSSEWEEKNNLFFHYCRSISKSTSYTKKYWKTKLEKIGYITSQLRNGPFNWNEWTLLQMWTDSHWSTASFQGRGCSAVVEPCLITKRSWVKIPPSSDCCFLSLVISFWWPLKLCLFSLYSQ